MFLKEIINLLYLTRGQIWLKVLCDYEYKSVLLEITAVFKIMMRANKICRQQEIAKQVEKLCSTGISYC